MWKVKKGLELAELHKTFKYERLKKRLLIFISLFMFLAIVLKLGLPIRGNIDRVPYSWSELFLSIPSNILISAIVTFFFTFRGRKKVLRCTTCEKQKLEDGNYECDCGGKFYRAEDMVWIEESPKK